MDLDVILKMSEVEFDEWLREERRVGDARLKESLEKISATFECVPLKKEHLADLHDLVTSPAAYKPTPVFMTEEELRALRKQHREKKPVQPLPPDQRDVPDS